jgi:pimeloyl-ACP methyl ester carboxylesterase
MPFKNKNKLALQLMDNPAAFPDSNAPIRADVTMRNMVRVVDFIRDLRNVEQVHLLGWSSGAGREAPLYAIQHPEKVARLVLYAGSYRNVMTPAEREKSAANAEAKKVLHSVPALENWASLGTKKDFVVPGCFEANRDALLASHPKSGELGGVIRVPGGRTIDEDLSDPYFDASKITVPTLVIRGSADTWAKREDNKLNRPGN